MADIVRIVPTINAMIARNLIVMGANIESLEEKNMKINDVVQFTEEHKWVGCFGFINEDKGCEHPRRYMIGVPVPEKGVAYIFDDGKHIEKIGEAVLVMEGEKA